MKVLILGGYGAMAQVAVRDLVENTATNHIIIAGRELAKARQFANSFQSKKDIEAAHIDVTKSNFAARIKHYAPDVVINATWYEYNMTVMPVVIASGALGYIDLGGLYKVTKQQLRLCNKAKQEGITCVLGMGSTPGIMNCMAAYVAQFFDRITTMKLRCGSRVIKDTASSGFVPPYSIKTILDEFTKKPVILHNGKLKTTPPLSIQETFTLPQPVGTLNGYATLHSELATLPRFLRKKHIKNMDFVVAYDPEFTHIITTLIKTGMASHMPVDMGGVIIKPYDLLTQVIRNLPKTSKTPYDIEVLRVEAYGIRSGKPQYVSMDTTSRYHTRWMQSAGSVDTGIPPSIIASWIASGKLCKPGVWAPEDIMISQKDSNLDFGHSPSYEEFFNELSKKNRGLSTFLRINRVRKRIGQK
ncbi:MAG: saccharopine dehydrogenase C-terminal domain-containing protein [Nanoarchaeota archaeon]